MASTEPSQLFTLKQLHEQTAQVMKQIHESGEPAIITRHGRALAMVTPLPEALEAHLLGEYLKDNPLSE